ncbi:VOC family protein [Gulosibacter chungangensis]|uniref:VOC family protein n=1 Tax=Gulosibacter chungangensis TaxID=979746 RepID=A0A7J5BFS4_9MICO|nr:VOC family protein [Gulosibacter chungangensis]KAB1645107.1 VOC family protein [Gulosibacter chungangensis]
MNHLTPENLYHTGFVVQDLDEAARTMSKALGYRWTKPATGNERPVVYADGTRTTVRLNYCYSIDSPHLELIEAVPGTPWALKGGSIHHLGYWVDDLVAASAELALAGFPLVVCAADDEGNYPARFAHHEGPDGAYIELVERSVFGKPFDEWLSTSPRFESD